MTVWLEKVYLNRVSYRLDKFSWKKNNLANFRCPLCGDSDKNQYKCRGYVYEKKGSLWMCCHNCGAGMSVGNFIKALDPALYKEFVYEKFKDDPFKARKEGAFDDVEPDKLYQELKKRKIELPSIDSLPKDHFARVYIANRKIPEKWYKELYFAQDFKKFVDALVPDHGKKLKENDPRVVIPFYDTGKNLIAVQGRALEQGDDVIRYLMIKTEPNVPKIWGLHHYDHTKQGYVLEGPFDSMFFDNSLAAAGSTLEDVENFVNKENTVFIHDNQPRNKEVVRQIEKTISHGCSVFVWPESLNTKKDINDLILTDYNPSEIRYLVDSNTFKNLEAQVRIQQWKKC